MACTLGDLHMLTHLQMFIEELHVQVMVIGSFTSSIFHLAASQGRTKACRFSHKISPASFDAVMKLHDIAGLTCINLAAIHAVDKCHDTIGFLLEEANSGILERILWLDEWVCL